MEINNKKVQSFIARIQLHYAEPNEYNELHRWMAYMGFTQSLPVGGINRLKLPRAEYYLTGRYTKEEVLGMVKWAAKMSGHSHPKIVVIVTAEIVSDGL